MFSRSHLAVFAVSSELIFIVKIILVWSFIFIPL